MAQRASGVECAGARHPETLHTWPALRPAKVLARARTLASQAVSIGCFYAECHISLPVVVRLGKQRRTFR